MLVANFARFFVCMAAVLHVSANIMGIDFGSDTMKVSLVQSGKALQIVTNFQSKRKTPSAVAFYRDERLYGSDGTALLPRKPEVVFVNPFRMLGRTATHPLVTELASLYFPYEVYSNQTLGHTCIKQGETHYTPEELVAIILMHAREMTEAFGGQPVKDTVITVPSAFTQHEREAVYAAAAIADINVLSLIEENSAVALQYAIDNAITDPRNVVFYNMGATTTQVSVVRFSTYTVKESKTSNKTISQFEVLGKAWDTHLGGLHIDVKLAELLADRFNEAWTAAVAKRNKGKPDTRAVKDIKQNVKVMSKLRMEANKLKEILSANAEFSVKLEQLHDDVTLATKVTRSELEALMGQADVLNRATAPLDAALADAGLTMRDVQAMEVIGGGFRVPSIKRKLEEYVKKAASDAAVHAAETAAAPAATEGEAEAAEGSEAAATPAPVIVASEVGQHLNSDESMTLGAGFRGANLSTSFRVRKIGMVDSLNYGIAVTLQENAKQPTLKAAGEAEGLGDEAEAAIAADEAAAAATLPPVGDDSLWKKHAVVFPSKTSLLAKPRTVAFNYNKDITCNVQADTSEGNRNLVKFTTGGADAAAVEGGDPLFGTYSIGGIAQFAKEMLDKGHLATAEEAAAAAAEAEAVAAAADPEATAATPTPTPAKATEPRVHLTFAVSPQSGIVYLSKAEVSVDIPKVPTPASPSAESDAAAAAAAASDDAEKSDKEKGEGSEAADKTDGAEGVDKEKADDADAAAKEGKDGKDGKDAKDTKEKAKKSKKSKKSSSKKGPAGDETSSTATTTTIRRSLTITEHGHLITPPVYSPAMIKDSKAKLNALVAADKARKERDAALNDLEATIYRIRNSFTDTDAANIAKVAREAAIESIVAQCNDLEEWLYDEGGRKADTAGFNAKKADLQAQVDPIYKRISELTALPAALTKAKNHIADLRAKVSEWELKYPHILANETEAVLAEMTKYERWLEGREDQHVLASPYGDEEEAKDETSAGDSDAAADGDAATAAPKMRRLLSTEVTAKLKPVFSIYRKYSTKPLPKIEKVTVTGFDDDEDNATANATETTADADADADADAGESKDAETAAGETSDASAGASDADAESAKQEL